MDNDVFLEWARFSRLEDAQNYGDRSCVYALADADGLVLYVGKAIRGLRNRYGNCFGLLEALLAHSNMALFVARVPEDLCAGAETAILYWEMPVYNSKGKAKRRNHPWHVVRHRGDHPHFARPGEMRNFETGLPI